MELGKTPGKTPLIEIRGDHYFAIPELAEQADVLATTVYNMLVGVPVPRREAEKVLAVVSFRTGRQYSLDNVDIKIEETPHATKSRQPE